MLKRLKTILLIGLIIVTLAACNGSSGNKPESSTDKSQSNTVVNEIIHDLEGKTVQIASRDGRPVGIDLTFEQRVSNAEAIANCKVEWIRLPSKSADAIAADLISGQHIADIIYISSKPEENMDIYNLIRNKAILPLDEYISFNNTLHNSMEQSAAYINGSHYGIVPAHNLSELTVLYYNKDLLEQRGCPDPYELFIKGEWTWENFLEIAKNTTFDVDGDGIIDRWGVFIRPHEGGPVIFDHFINSNGAAYAKDENGKVKFSLTDPAAIEAIKFVAELYNVHRVALKRVQTANIGGENGLQCAFSDIGYAGVGEGSVTGKNVGKIPYPKGPNADKSRFAGAYGGFYAIPSTSENPGALAVLLDYIYPYNDPERSDYVDPYENRRRTDPEFVATAEAGCSYVHREFGLSLGSVVNPLISGGKKSLATIIQPIFNKIIDNEISIENIETSISNVSYEAQRFLDSKYNQFQE